jgi:DNA excision repair protein ERCC-1
MSGSGAPPSKEGGSGAPLLVANRQQGNPLLRLLTGIEWKHADVVPDFVVGETTCVLFLSLRYHLLHPDYLYARIAPVKREFRVRVLLVSVDVADPTVPLLLLTSLASANDFTVILGWSLQECARYLETFKLLDKKSAASIQERIEAGYLPRLEDALTVIRSVNKTDVRVLSRTFGSLKEIMAAPMEDLALCQGLGDKKVRRLFLAFNEPFLASSAAEDNDG